MNTYDVALSERHPIFDLLCQKKQGVVKLSMDFTRAKLFNPDGAVERRIEESEEFQTCCTLFDRAVQVYLGNESTESLNPMLEKLGLEPEIAIEKLPEKGHTLAHLLILAMKAFGEQLDARRPGLLNELLWHFSL